MRSALLPAAIALSFVATGALAQQQPEAAAQPAPAPQAAAAAPAAPAKKSEAEEARDTLHSFYGIQVVIAECGLKIAAKDAAKLKSLVELMEIGSKLPAAELAQLKGKAMVEVKTEQEKSCAEGKIGIAGLGPMLDEMDKQLGGALTKVASMGQQVPTSAAGAEAPAGAKLQGLAAIQALVGNTISIKVDGQMQYDFLMPDGIVKNMEGSEISTGKWAAEGAKLCYRYEGYDKVCYGIEMAGKDVTLTDKDGQGWRYRLMDGNPKNL